MFDYYNNPDKSTEEAPTDEELSEYEKALLPQPTPEAEHRVITGFRYDVMKQVWVCESCGSIAQDVQAHAQWHRSLDEKIASLIR